MIIDANIFGIHLSEQTGSPFCGWMEEGHGIAVYTGVGRYAKELKKSPRMVEAVVEYRRAGVAKKVSGVDIGQARKWLRDNVPQLSSDDEHILELAVAGWVVMLYSDDSNLHLDFKALPRVGNRHRAVFPFQSARKVQERFLAQHRCPSRGGRA